MIALGLLVALAGWPTSDDARRAAVEVTRAEVLQTELPGTADRPAPSFTPSAPVGARSGPRRSSAPPSGAGDTLGTTVLVVLGVLMIIGLAAVLIRERTGPTAVERSAIAAPRAPPSPPPASIVDEADALAAAGRFADAVHALLLRTIDALSRDTAVPRAMTSRELEASARLPAEARRALGALVASVEVTRFGGRSADADDYARAVSCFEAIRAALGAT